MTTMSTLRARLFHAAVRVPAFYFVVVLLGAVIGTMVICLYLPMFSIYQHIQS